MSVHKFIFAAALLAITTCTSAIFAQTTNVSSPVTADQDASGKYTFYLFYKTGDAPSLAMRDGLAKLLANDLDRAQVVQVQVGSPKDQALVTKYDVARAPMPITVAVAPNGAITGMFPTKVTAANVEAAFVSPTMMKAMKALQEGKLVFVTVQGAGKEVMPAALPELQKDPHFGARIVPLAMYAADQEEAPFVKQMQIDPQSLATQTVLLAPPGVLVGKFAATAKASEITAALVKAGKCCDDPNCKHNQEANQATKGTATRK